MIIDIFLLILGFILLVKGADFFVDGASSVAEKLKIPSLIIGLTIVAMGTSAPEAAVSITAGFDGNADITIGNIVGSNILNILIILGIASVMIRILVAKSTILYEIPMMIGCSVLLMLLGLDGMISRLDGVILWLAFLAYFVYLFISAKSQKEEVEAPVKEIKIWLALVMTIGGLVILVLGSKIAVHAASDLARLIGISERFIGLTIVALGTSLPELFTSVIAARKGNADIAVGNIVGSNIFNILFVVGTTSLVVNVPYDAKFLVDGVIMIASAVLLWIFTLREKEINRIHGILFLIGYALYFGYLCMS